MNDDGCALSGYNSQSGAQLIPTPHHVLDAQHGYISGSTPVWHDHVKLGPATPLYNSAINCI